MSHKTSLQEAALPARRQPRQARAMHKVELILEAAMRLLDQGEISALTTNAVAEKAGVSIGSLYQYFGDKQAILDALMERELAGLSANALDSLAGSAPTAPGERIRSVVRAVLGAYGGRARVHRLLMEHALMRGTGGRLNPLYSGIVGMLTSAGVAGPDSKPQTLPAADAFVLTYAIAGVLRGYVALGEQPAGRQEIEDALVRLTVRFLGLDESEAQPAAAASPGVSRRRSRPASRSTPG